MLARYLPLMRFFLLVLALALAGTLGLFAHFMITGGKPDAPRTELERAVFAAEEAVRSNPEDGAARVKLAAAYLEDGGHGSAKEQAELAIRLTPEDPAGYYVLALSQDASGDTAAALENLKQAVETEGQMAQFYQDAYLALARIQEREGDLKAALDSFDEALKRGPENAVLLHERGLMYERNEMWALALLDFKWAVTFVPDFTEAQEAFDRVAAEHPDAIAEMEKIDDMADQPAPHGGGQEESGEEESKPAEEPAGN